MRLFLIILFLAPLGTAFCQGPPNDAPRVDDHFWRRRVEMSLDLDEKMNRPLKTKENDGEKNYTWTEGNSALHFKKGLVFGLLYLYRNGDIQGYRTDTLDAPYEWSEFETMITTIDEAAASEPVLEEQGGEEASPIEDEFDMGDFDFDMDEELEFDEAVEPVEPAEDVASGVEQLEQWVFDYELEKELLVIEDRIFDKNKSDMYYDIKYIQIRVPRTSSNPVLAGKKVVTFHYDEVEEYLDNINWKNPNNDAEYRSMKEIFEMRRFNSVDYVISGRAVKSMDETAYRRNRMINFEHALWEY